MALGRYGTFHGGIDLPAEKHATLDSPVRPCPPPDTLLVPLAPCGQTPAEPLATAGQTVAAGQRLARATDNSCVDIFAPLSGRVVGFTEVDVAAPDGFVRSPAMELADLTQAAEAPEPLHDDTWQSTAPAAIRARLGEGGLTTFRVPLEPLAAVLHRAITRGCRTLIANLMENQPHLTAEHRLLAEHGREIIAGLAILGRAIGAETLIVAADRRRTSAYAGLSAVTARYHVQQIALPHKYPIGADVILTEVLMRRRVPAGESVMSLGAAVVSGATCLATYRWIACGQVPTMQVVTVGGPLATSVGNFLVPIGTPCTALTRTDGLLIHGGPMTGYPCTTDAVVSAATDAVLAIQATEAHAPGPCIRCGWCADHCPAQLNVAALNDAFELGQIDAAQHDMAPACVDCGVCSYVCPARLPLMQRVKKLKQAIVAAQSGTVIQA